MFGRSKSTHDCIACVQLSYFMLFALLNLSIYNEDSTKVENAKETIQQSIASQISYD